MLPGQRKSISPGALIAGITLGVWLTGAILERAAAQDGLSR